MYKNNPPRINCQLPLLGLVIAISLAPAASCREWSIDGRTVNPSKVIDQAQSKGTISVAQAEQLRNEELKLADADKNPAQQASTRRSVLALVRKVEDMQSQRAASASFSGAEQANPALANVSQEKRDDVLILQNVRTRLTGDPSLSSRAQNVELSVDNRMLTLRGAVTSVIERDAVLAIARQYVGKDHVFDQLVVEGK